MRSIILSLVLVGGCTRDSESRGGGDAASSPRDPVGRLELLVTDAPIPGVSAVNVCFERIDVTFAEGDEAPPTTVVTNPGTFDLLALQNGVTATLGIAELPAGFIQQIRPIMCAEGNTIVVDGVEHPLIVPSGTETGIKLTRPGGFEIRDNLTTTVIIDFDASESIRFAPGNGYMMSPVVRLLDAVVISIESPVAGATIVSQPFPVTGRYESRHAGDPVASVDVNGAAATLFPDGTYTALASTPLDAADAVVRATASTSEGLVAIAEVTVRVLIVDAQRSSVVVESTPIIADGVGVGTIVIQLMTATGIPVANLDAGHIRVDADDAEVDQPTAPTDGDGRTTTTITSTSTGLKRITVTVINGGSVPLAVFHGFASFVTPRAGCGDGRVGGVGEKCDDGNVVSGDGCRADCLGAIAPQGGYGDYVLLVVDVLGNGDYEVHCESCDRVLEVRAHEIADPFRMTSRTGAVLGEVVEVMAANSVRLAGPQLTNRTAVAFDCLVEQNGRVQAAAAHFFFRVDADDNLGEASWAEHVCGIRLAACVRDDEGRVVRIVRRTESTEAGP